MSYGVQKSLADTVLWYNNELVHIILSHASLLQSFSQFWIGVLFEVITHCMVPSEIKFWYDDNI